MGLPFKLDKEDSRKVTLGLIVLQSDETLENELRQIFGDPDIALYHARIPSHPVVTKETLAQMAEDLPFTASLLPVTQPFDAIGYACTSGATVIGQEVVAQKVRQTHPQVAVTDPITAVMAGCRAVGAKKLGFLTPYLPEVSQAMRALLEKNGFEISAFGSFEQEQEEVVSRISETSTLEALLDIGRNSDCDALFASCTNLQTFGILAEAEDILGKPVISSNSALAWHLLRLAGDKNPRGPGRLFSV
ncbi:maleate cis-trans isomerase family protein [Rhodovibrionaceae bacterium A322]